MLFSQLTVEFKVLQKSNILSNIQKKGKKCKMCWFFFADAIWKCSRLCVLVPKIVLLLQCSTSTFCHVLQQCKKFAFMLRNTTTKPYPPHPTLPLNTSSSSSWSSFSRWPEFAVVTKNITQSDFHNFFPTFLSGLDNLGFVQKYDFYLSMWTNF